MPVLVRLFIKTSMLYLILALCTGVLLVWPGGSPLPGLFPVYVHTLTFGWLTQLIFGVALWMFPKYSSKQPRGPEWLGWAAYGLLNGGLVLRVVFEPLQSAQTSALGGWMLVAAALLQWLAGAAFVALVWVRVKEK